MLNRKTNPKHHNAGRIPTLNQYVTLNLNWCVFTLKGFIGALDQAAARVSHNKDHADWDKYPHEDRLAQRQVAQRMSVLAKEAKDLADDIAEYNRDKYKIPNLRSVKREIKGRG